MVETLYVLITRKYPVLLALLWADLEQHGERQGHFAKAKNAAQTQADLQWQHSYFPALACLCGTGVMQGAQAALHPWKDCPK